MLQRHAKYMMHERECIRHWIEIKNKMVLKEGGMNRYGREDMGQTLRLWCIQNALFKGICL